MKRLIPLMFLSTSVMGQECPSFSIQQLHVLQQAYDKGTPYDLGYTMAAITLHESHAGEVLVGINKGRPNDYGVAMVNIGTAAKRLEINNSYKKNILASKLVTDVDFNLHMSLAELLYWKEHKDGWSEVVSAYNSGWNTEHGRTHYLPEIKKALTTIQGCVKL